MRVIAIFQFSALTMAIFVCSGPLGMGQATPTTAGVTYKPLTTMVETEPSVKIEVLDWGGSGPPLVLLAGLGAAAHNFDSFALALRPSFHVYAISRRGYGGSSAPRPTGENYSADRLADDVLAVLDRLRIHRPLLVGHSLAGEELSSIGSRTPERVCGLVYLDAGYRYALSRPGLGDLQIDIISMRRYLAAALDGISAADEKSAVEAFLKELPEFEKELNTYLIALSHAAPVSADEIAKDRAERESPQGRAERAILDSEQRFASIRCPVLAIFAYPHQLPKEITGQARVEAERRDMEFVDQRAGLFRVLPNARVVLLPHATHGVQDSRRVDVLKDIQEFAGKVER